MQVDDVEQPASETETEAAEAEAAREHPQDSNELSYSEEESTEQGSGPEFCCYSDEVEDYHTASDSDAPWQARCRSGNPGSSSSWRSVGNSTDPDFDMSDAEDSPTNADDEATDAEEYDAEAEQEQQEQLAGGSRSDGSKNADISDPDTEDETAADDPTAAAAAAGSSSDEMCSAAAAHDAAALRQIRHYQRTTHALLSGKAFRQLCEETIKPINAYLGITSHAVKALQTAAEAYLIELMQGANTAAGIQGRQKVQVQDIRTVRKMRGEAVRRKGSAVLQYKYEDCGAAVTVKETIECEYEV
jgi:histone H3/H4